ncbi:MAG: ATP-binding protein [Anaerolineaceae bacterium]|nr:ATP-binding protein [Anaerolineaceae bacterium]
MEKTAAKSIRNIRRRLILTVVRAFAIVVILTVISLLALTVYELNNKTKSNPFYKSPSTMLLEAFYIGNGGWSNIDRLVNASQTSNTTPGQQPPDQQPPDQQTPADVQPLTQPAPSNQQFPAQDWNDSIVLDQDSVVLIDHGKTNSDLIGTVYTPAPGQPTSTIEVNGKVVGWVIRDLRDLPHPLRLSIAALYPVAEVAVFLAILAVVIGILLTRRVVNPIAEVIAAAEKVSKGDLSTRITMKKGSDDLSALVEHFNDMTAALEQNDNERRQLLADIAHELRTPLSVLRGRLEGIVDGIYPINEANIAPALEETYLLERLVEDLRLLTLAETRQLRFEQREIDLNELLDRTMTVFKPEAVDKDVALNLELAPDLPKVWVDPQRLEQVIGNILDNALRYTKEKGTITVTGIAHEDGVYISIADSGSGVPEDEIGRIFDRFWRNEKSRARSNGGAGLGLAIARQLIEAQGGKIGAENVPTGGLKIWFILPEK